MFDKSCLWKCISQKHFLSKSYWNSFLPICSLQSGERQGGYEGELGTKFFGEEKMDQNLLQKGELKMFSFLKNFQFRELKFYLRITNHELFIRTRHILSDQ